MEKKKILFADDDPEIREALRLLLNCEGYDTVEASCGEEVLEQMDHSIDLVILDVMMPRMNGYTVCAQIPGFRQNHGFFCRWRRLSGKTLFL